MVRDLIKAEERLVLGLSPVERARRLYMGQASEWDQMLAALTMNQTGSVMFQCLSNIFMHELCLFERLDSYFGENSNDE